MPIYGFRCTKDEKHTEEHYYPFRSEELGRACESCGAPMVRDLRVEARTHIPSSAFPYVTKNITGKPIVVRSSEHLRQLEKEHGVRLRDDCEYIEEEFRGVENRFSVDREGKLKSDFSPTYGGGRGGGRGCRWV